MRHYILREYTDGDVSIAQIDIDYTRHDGRTTVPNADILTSTATW
jgi:hypothetical protein